MNMNFTCEKYFCHKTIQEVPVRLCWCSNYLPNGECCEKGKTSPDAVFYNCYDCGWTGFERLQTPRKDEK